MVRPRPVLFLLPLLMSCGGGASPPGGDPIPTVTPPPVAGCASIPVANEGWVHVVEGSAISYRANPPASGPHYPVWARYEDHGTPVARGYWVHDLEHGAVVFLYRPGAPASTVSALRDAYRALPNDPACGHKRALLTADPELPVDTAVVAADFMLQAGCTDTAGVLSFATSRRGRGPEQECANGTRP